MKSIFFKIFNSIYISSEIFLKKKQWKELTSKDNVIFPQKLFLNRTFQLVLEEAEVSKIDIANSVTCRSNCFMYVGKNAELIIEENVFFNNNCSVNCLESIEIGESTIFGEGVKIYDHNHLYKKMNDVLHVDREDFSTKKVTIGKNCWIASNVIILKGVVIGDNVIIGANCLIHKSIASNVIVKCSQNLIIEDYG